MDVSLRKMLPKPIPLLNEDETKRFQRIDERQYTPEEVEDTKRNVELFLDIKIRK